MVSECERLFAARQHMAHALATTSSTAGLHLSTLAVKVGP